MYVTDRDASALLVCEANSKGQTVRPRYIMAVGVAQDLEDGRVTIDFTGRVERFLLLSPSRDFTPFSRDRFPTNTRE